MTEGYIKLHKDKGMTKWVDQRTSERSTMERWGPGVCGSEGSTGPEGSNTDGGGTSPEDSGTTTDLSGAVEGSFGA